MIFYLENWYPILLKGEKNLHDMYKHTPEWMSSLFYKCHLG